MGCDAPAVRLRFGHPRRLGAGADRWRLYRTGDPPDRPSGPRGGDPPGGNAGRRPSGRGSQGRRAGLPHAGHDADQAHGRRPDRIHARTGHPRALHAQRHRHDRTDRDPARPAPWGVRRACRHQPVARGAGYPRMRAGRHSGRGQGRLPAVRDLADPDHWPRRAQRRRPRHHVCRPRDGQHGARAGRDQPAPRETGGLQRGPRDHARDGEEERRGHPGRPLQGRRRHEPGHGQGRPVDAWREP